jgi:hypothetical protein
MNHLLYCLVPTTDVTSQCDFKPVMFVDKTINFTESCSRVVSNPASFLGGPGFNHLSGYNDLGLTWFSSESSVKCLDSTSNYFTTNSFHILSSSLFTKIL